MSAPSRRELARLFDDESLAAEARFLAVATAWPSLRILDHLHSDGPATTGEVARALNMDMAEVRDRLEDLVEAGVVAADGDSWLPATDHVEVRLAGDDDGLEVYHALDDPAADDGRAAGAGTHGRDDARTTADGSPELGPFASLGRRLDALLP
jgi:hypothetical protein